jgi:heat shock protein HslJ
MRRIAVLAVLALTLTACSGDDYGDSLDGSWQLVSGEVDGTAVPILDTHPITLTIEDTQMGGTAACNGYGGVLSIDGDLFAITEFAINETACRPEAAMQSEAVYTTALFMSETVKLTDDGLTISGPDVILKYEPLASVPTADLLGTVWVLTGLVQGETVSSVSGERATLELFTDGSFIGSTGCRDISGSYIVTGAEIQFTNWGANGECSTDLVRQDSQVISALEGGFRVDIEEDQMTTWVAGDEGLIYHADR